MFATGREEYKYTQATAPSVPAGLDIHRKDRNEDQKVPDSGKRIKKGLPTMVETPSIQSSLNPILVDMLQTYTNAIHLFKARVLQCSWIALFTDGAPSFTNRYHGPRSARRSKPTR